jgi:hypothetical protein
MAIAETGRHTVRFRNRAWIPVAWALSLLNLVSVGVYAGGPGETLHVTAHAVLAVLFGLGAQRLAARRSLAAEADVRDHLQEIEERLSDMTALPSADSRLPELEERLDFIERALVEVRNRTRIPPKA